LDASFHTQGLLLTGFGSSWTVTQAPLPANAATSDPRVSISSVSCPSGSLCTAVGAYSDTSGNTQGLLLTGSGTTWTATEAPLPTGAQTGESFQLRSVTCPAASPCTAVGDLDTEGGFLLTGTGSSWTATQAPVPTNNDINSSSNLTSVACVAATCLAVGTYHPAGNNYPNGLLISGTAASWSAIEAPLPPNIGYLGNELPAVTCVRTTSTCVAVGSYHDQAGNYQGLLITGPP
jgi:hypothetical protein